MEITVGARVDLRKHVADRERDAEREYGSSLGLRLTEGEVIEHDSTRDDAYRVRWDNGVTQQHRASDLKIIQMNGRRARHEELYGEHGLKHRVERTGEALQDAIREMWVSRTVRRLYHHSTGVTDDFEGLHGAGKFDEIRAEYDRIVAEFNRRARRHDRDNCC
jgi:hypothetical protein